MSPCFKKRVKNQTIDNPELCEAEPSNEIQMKINAAVQELNHTVVTSSDLSTLAEEMYDDVPKDYEEYCPGDFDSLILYLKVVATITPPFHIPDSNFYPVPITTVLLCFLHTEKGRVFFATPQINSHMIKIVNTYAKLL